MAELKTRPNNQSVNDFLDRAAEGARRQECDTILALLKEITGKSPVMWGASLVGFGRYQYTNTQGVGQWMLTGFSPRKHNLTLYIMNGFSHYPELMARLGKHKTGKSCLYVKTLNDIDLDVLRELITRSVADMKASYECNGC